MGLEVHNRGPGRIGKPEAGWSMSLPVTPYRFGLGGGSIGSVDFTADCDWTVRFSIDNYLSIQHYLDDDTNVLGLTTFDGSVKSIITDGENASISASSFAAALNRDMDVPFDATGRYLRTFSLPVGVEYDLNGTMYQTGSDLVLIDGTWTRVESLRDIYDMDAFANKVYILAQGGSPVSTAVAQQPHSVVYEHYADGTFVRVWPVYSDSNDLANNSVSTCITVGEYSASLPWPTIYVGQTSLGATSRFKRFDSVGTFEAQYGSTGTSNGQFTELLSISATPYVGQSRDVFIADGAVDEVQSIGGDDGLWNDTYGGADFNNPHAVAVGEANVLIGDDSGRVRMYSHTGNSYHGTIADVDTLAPGVRMKISVDSLGYTYVFQSGRVYMYAKDNAFGAGTDGIFRKSWDGPAGSTYIGTVDKWGGTGFFLGENGLIQSFATVPTTLEALILYYIGHAAPDLRVNVMELNDPRPVLDHYGDAPGPWGDPYWVVSSWSGNVWDRLNELCSVTGNEISLIGDTVYVGARGDRSFPLPVGATISPMTLSSGSEVERVEAVSKNSKWFHPVSLNISSNYVFWSAWEERKTMSCDVGTYEVHVIPIDGDVLQVISVDPGLRVRAPDVLTENTGLVLRSGKFTITDFYNAGGKIEARQGSAPGTLEIVITGPREPLTTTNPNGNFYPVPGPYEFREWDSMYTDFSVLATGVRNYPTTMTIGTGVSSVDTSQSVMAIESPFLLDEELAGGEAARAAYATTPTQRITVTIPFSSVPDFQGDGERRYGSHSFTNSKFYHLGSEFIVIEAEQGADGLVLVAERYNIGSHSEMSTGIDLEGRLVSGAKRLEEIWKGTTSEEFERFWTGISAGEFNISPLDNPFGYNS